MAESSDSTARDARMAVRLQPDVSAEQIGRIYAKALLGASEKAGQSAVVLEDFDAVIDDLFQQYPQVESLLASAMILPEEKSGLLERLFAGRVVPLLLNFFKVVARRDRLECLRAIRDHAWQIYEELQGRVRVRLATATPLDEAQKDRIREELRAKLGREPVLEVTVDPGLIGGAVLRLGDTLYDGSVANQLQLIRQQMIDRSGKLVSQLLKEKRLTETD